MEDLLTACEISEIIREATNSIYADPFHLHLESQKTSIRRTCNKTGIILINGNQWTGYQHIVERHSLISRKPYWNENKLGNPSKLPLELDEDKIVKIAGTIFTGENRNAEKNKAPDVFDTFIGTYTIRQYGPITFTLVTYKQTGVIHTFYVSDNRKPFNKKKVLDLRQGWFTESYDCMKCIRTLTMSYFDSANIEKFKVILRYIETLRIRRWYIQINSEIGDPLITKFIKEEELATRSRVMAESLNLNFSDFSWIEKIIKRLINENANFPTNT